MTQPTKRPAYNSVPREFIPSTIRPPVTRGESRLMRDLQIADGTESLEELAVKLDRHDEIFMELVRLRREQVRLPFWKFRARRSVEDRIAVLKREQAAL